MPEIRLVRLDGSRDRLLVTVEGYAADLAWSPDGRQLAAVLSDPGRTQRIVVFTVSAKPTAVTLKSTGWNFPVLGGFSPDGKHLVYIAQPHTTRVRRRDLCDGRRREP